MSTQLSQIAKKAKLDRKARFTSLAHLLTPEFLKETWGKMNRRASDKVDGQSTEQFASELERQVEAICKQLKEGAYRAPPVRRVEIPKGPGKIGTRPLGIPTVADRLLQRAVARILEAVFEADFLDLRRSPELTQSCSPEATLVRNRISNNSVRRRASSSAPKARASGSSPIRGVERAVDVLLEVPEVVGTDAEFEDFIDDGPEVVQ